LAKTLLFCLVISQSAWASDTAAPGVQGSNYLQAVLALGLIIALLLGITWLARKVTGGKGFGQGGLKVVGGVALGPRERLVLIEAGDTWLVIGVVPGQIRTLHQMPKGSLVSESLPDDAPFSRWLKAQIAQRTND
jgi:flagellar protein FliO/FliZ